MSHFHCLHGAWHGAWVWQALARELAPGHTLTAPDLPGMGADFGNLDKSIELEDHILAAKPEQPGVLVAHSYAGMLARAVVDRWPDRVSHLVLIEALWPQSGQSVMDLLPPNARNAIKTDVALNGQGWMIPPPDAAQFDIESVQLTNTVSARLTPQPLATYSDKLMLNRDCPAGTYIVSTDRRVQPYQSTVDRLRQSGWKIVQMCGGHELMLTSTRALVQVLLEVIRDKDFAVNDNRKSDEKRAQYDLR